MTTAKREPSIAPICGNYFVDERGILIANNNFSVSDYKRFYVIRNHRINFVRAWHGHQFESKAIICLRGSFKVGIIAIDDFSKPDKNQKIETYILDSSKGSILKIPPGCVNGFMNLTEDSELLVFSDKTLEESKNDDIRYPFDFWNIWDIAQC